MRKETTHNLKHTTSAVKHSAGNVMVWACRTTKELGHWCWLMIWLLIEVAGRIGKCTELNFLLRFKRRQCFTVQMAKNHKETAKAIQEFLTPKKCDILQQRCQSPDLNRHLHAFPIQNTKRWMQGDPKTSSTESGWSKPLAEHLKGENTTFGYLHVF